MQDKKKTMTVRVDEKTDEQLASLLDELNANRNGSPPWSKSQMLRTIVNIGATVLTARAGDAHEARRKSTEGDAGKYAATCPDVCEHTWSRGSTVDDAINNLIERLEHLVRDENSLRVFVGHAASVNLGDLISNKALPGIFQTCDALCLLEESLYSNFEDPSSLLEDASPGQRAMLSDMIGGVVDAWCEMQGVDPRVGVRLADDETKYILLTHGPDGVSWRYRYED